MDLPYGVSSCLFNGISGRIEYLTRVIKSDSMPWEDFEETLLSDTKEAVEWYKEHIMISSTHLEEDLNELFNLYDDKIVKKQI